jgi:hypothetical protein
LLIGPVARAGKPNSPRGHGTRALELGRRSLEHLPERVFDGADARVVADAVARHDPKRVGPEDVAQTDQARIGVSLQTSEYADANASDDRRRDGHQRIELPVVFTVLPRLALMAGPTLDITFSGHGGGSGPYQSYEEHVTELGIQGGVLIHL